MEEGQTILKTSKMNFWKILFIFTLLPSTILAQEEEFSADRPGATTGTDVMPVGRLQWETGAGYERDKSSAPTEHTWTLNTSLLRYGMAKFAELRLQNDIYSTHADGDALYGSIAIGTKINMFGGCGLLPAISLLGDVAVPYGKRVDGEHRRVGGQLHALFDTAISHRWSLGCDVGLDWDDNDSDCTVFLGACLSFQATDNLGLFVEEYNHFGNGHTSWLETGLSYQIGDNLQLDVATDISLNAPADHFVVQFGVAWRM